MLKSGKTNLNQTFVRLYFNQKSDHKQTRKQKKEKKGKFLGKYDLFKNYFQNFNSNKRSTWNDIVTFVWCRKQNI